MDGLQQPQVLTCQAIGCHFIYTQVRAFQQQVQILLLCREFDSYLATIMESRAGSKKIGDFIIGKTIGEGTFGKVKQGIHMPSGHKVAIKILEKNKIAIHEDLARVHNELRILYKKVDHPNIIKLLQLHESPTTVYIITEFIEGTELYQLIVEKGSLDPRLCGVYFGQLLDAVSYLHSIGICHRDIKPENIMVQGDSLKLIDFGLSTEFGDDRMLRTSCGSPCYAAPEMLKGTKYDCVKSDIWAMGVTLYAMAAGHLPFEHENTDRLYELINTGCFEPIFSMPQSLTEQTSPSVSPYILSHSTSISLINLLLQKMLRIAPEKRTTIKQINESIWVKEWQHYLKATRKEFQNDEILLNSMGKYFKLTVNEIRDILRTKEIMSICTYYFLNRRRKEYQLTVRRQQDGDMGMAKGRERLKSKSKEKERTFNSPKSKTISQNNSLHNPESNSKGPKCQSVILQSSLLTKSILQEINNKNPLPVQPSRQPTAKMVTGMDTDTEEQKPEIHRGCFHIKYTFATLEDVHNYIETELKAAHGGDHAFVGGKIVEEQSEEENQDQYQGNKFYRQPSPDQQSSQQQYIVHNNKYLLAKGKPSRCSSGEPPKQRPTVLRHSPYIFQYSGVIIKVKMLENSSMFYLDLPSFFN